MTSPQLLLAATVTGLAMVLLWVYCDACEQKYKPVNPNDTIPLRWLLAAMGTVISVFLLFIWMVWLGANLIGKLFPDNL